MVMRQIKNPPRRVATEGSAQAADSSATYALPKYENQTAMHVAQPYRLFHGLRSCVSHYETIASGSASGSGGTAPPPGWATVVPSSVSTSVADIGAATR